MRMVKVELAVNGEASCKKKKERKWEYLSSESQFPLPHKTNYDPLHQPHNPQEVD